jgi:hypothetical protein
MTMVGGDVPTGPSETEILGVSPLPTEVRWESDLEGIGRPGGGGWYRAGATYPNRWATIHRAECSHYQGGQGQQMGAPATRPATGSCEAGVWGALPPSVDPQLGRYPAQFSRQLIQAMLRRLC